ncbi:MAG: DUF1800 family protein [Planctomycetota bacterium]
MTHTYAVFAACGTVAACLPATAQPTLTHTEVSRESDWLTLDVGSTGPFDIYPFAFTDGPIVLGVEFDESIEAIRRVEMNGHPVEFEIDEEEPARVEVFVDEPIDGTVLSFEFTDVADDGGGVAPKVYAEFGLLRGDFSGDGRVDLVDISDSFIPWFLDADERADLNADGIIDLLDIDAIIRVVLFGGTLSNTAPRISGPSSAFVPTGGEGYPLEFRVRDDRTAPDNLNFAVASSDSSLIDPSNVSVEVIDDGIEIVAAANPGSQGTATLTITIDDGQAQSFADIAVRVGNDELPTARLDVAQYLGVAPLNVTFDGSASSDAEGPIIRHVWGVEGQFVEGERLDWTFATPGEYPVTLIVTDSSGRDSSAATTVTVAASEWSPDAPISEQEAKRFLWQAGWGASPSDVAFVRSWGYSTWIDIQEQVQGSYFTEEMFDDIAQDLVDNGTFPSLDEVEPEFLLYELLDDFCVTGSDQLRQRAAWALLQVVPLRANFDFGSTFDHADVYNIYLRNALADPGEASEGNYYDFLSEITYSGSMGDWLTYKFNRKADTVLNTSPDENYAREVMQLFSIGLFERNPDGTPVLDPFGARIPTYDNSDIRQFARIFTGLVDADLDGVTNPSDFDPSPRPMLIFPPYHEPGSKQLLNYPGVLPANGFVPAVPFANPFNVASDIDAALMNLFFHPSHAPFLAELMIKRFTMSNPTPAYVGRVAQAYLGDGPFGQGAEGDINAMLRAILLDDEARNPAYRSNPAYGRVLEPMQIVLSSARSTQAIDTSEPLGLRSRIDTGLYLMETTAQGFYLTPSVFNFYQPNYTPANSPLANSGNTAPELQIFHEFTAIAGLDSMSGMVLEALEDFDVQFFLDLEAQEQNPDALARLIAGRLDHGWATEEVIGQIRAALTSLDIDRRVTAAVLFTLGHPEFRVLR